jgi:hypothetical protein
MYIERIFYLPDLSKVAAKIPASASKDPGCATVEVDWKQYPVLLSQNFMEPLSPHDTTTPSSLMATQFTTELCPEKFFKNLD